MQPVWISTIVKRRCPRLGKKWGSNNGALTKVPCQPDIARETHAPIEAH